MRIVREVTCLLATGILIGSCELGPEDSQDNIIPWPPMDGAGIDNEPDWGPDGNTIAYVHDPYVFEPGYGPLEIWLLDLQTREMTSLTPGRWPAWAPDGGRIAFERDGDIYVIDVEPGSITRLTDWGSCFHPSWSPDGGRIVYGVGENRPVVPLDSTGIWIMNADGSGRQQVTWFYGSAPDWSPDALRLALVWGLAENAPYGEIALLGLADSSVVRLTENRRDDRHPAWSPDSGQIAWESYGEGSDPTSGVWVMNADGSGQHLLAQWGGRPSWSPDGTKIVYVDYNEGSKTVTLWIMNADGTDPHPLTTPEDYE